MGRTCPDAMMSCTSLTTIGMMVIGLEMQVASPTMPGWITCASIWPKPATIALRPASEGTRTPAGRMNGLTMSPGRSANCSSVPSTPA